MLMMHLGLDFYTPTEAASISVAYAIAKLKVEHSVRRIWPCYIAQLQVLFF